MSLPVIAGITTSTVDFPGCVATVIHTQGCNFKCPFCHNPSTIPCVKSKGVKNFDSRSHWEYASTGDMLADKRKLFMENIVITGGEPTIWGVRLLQLCAGLRARGKKIKVDSNGSRPTVLKSLIENGLVDYIAIDVKTVPAKYNLVIGDDCSESRLAETMENIMASIELAASLGPTHHEFRTTCAPVIVSKYDLVEMEKLLPEDSPYFIQSCMMVSERMYDPGFFNGIEAPSKHLLNSWRRQLFPKNSRKITVR